MPRKDRCPFCHIEVPVLENAHAVAVYDTAPVAPGHMLFLTRRHVSDWFETSAEERLALLDLADLGRALLDCDRRPDGFNLGVNVGEAAGQTVFHVHLHLIPRYRGDVANPRGGVRGVIPTRQSY